MGSYWFWGIFRNGGDVSVREWTDVHNMCFLLVQYAVFFEYSTNILKHFLRSEGTEPNGVCERVRREDDDECHLDSRGGRLPLGPLTTDFCLEIDLILIVHLAELLQKNSSGPYTMKWNSSTSHNIPVLHVITFFSSLYFYHQITTLYCQMRGLNYLQINSLWGIIVASKALAEVPTGMFADTIGRKYTIMMALAFQLAGELLFIFADRYVIFVLMSVIAGIGFAFLSGCFEAMLYDSLSEQHNTNEIQKISGFNNAAGQAAIIIGSFTGSFLASDLRLVSFMRVIILTACSVGLALVASGWLREPMTLSSQVSQSSWQRLQDGFLLIKTNRSFQRILLLSVVTTPFLNYLLILFQPYFVNAKVPGVWFGISLAAASCLGVLASKYAYMLEKTWGVSKGIFLATWLPDCSIF